MQAKKAAFNYTRQQYSSLNEIRHNEKFRDTFKTKAIFFIQNPSNCFLKPFKTSITLNAVLIIDELLTATLLHKGLSKLSTVFFFNLGTENIRT